MIIVLFRWCYFGINMPQSKEYNNRNLYLPSWISAQNFAVFVHAKKERTQRNSLGFIHARNVWCTHSPSSYILIPERSQPQ